MILKKFTEQPAYVTITLTLDEVRILRNCVTDELRKSMSAIRANVSNDKVLSELKKKINDNIPKLTKLECDLSLYASLLNYGQMDEGVARSYNGYYELLHDIEDSEEKAYKECEI